MRLLCLGVGLLLMTGCDRPKPMPDEQNAVTAFALQRFVDADEITGAVTAVVGPDGLIAVEAFGLADVGGQRPMRKDSLFWIGGMTRTMTAVGVMMLVEAGKVNLEDPLGKYVPAFRDVRLKTAQGLVAPRRPITLKDLLTHASGIDPTPATPLGEPVDTLGLAAMAEAYARRPLTDEPGAKWADNDNGINLLGRVIEVASGQAYADFMQQRLIEPLGMENTTFWPDPDQLDQLAKPYAKDRANGGLIEAKNPWFSLPLHDDRRTPFPAGGLYSCVRDLGRFQQMLLGRGQLDGRRYLKAATLKQMTTAQTGEAFAANLPKGRRVGLGFNLVGEPTDDTEGLSHGAFGQAGVFGPQAWADPAKQRAYMLLIQRTDLTPTERNDISREFHKAVTEAYGK